ncbi:MAG TPA: DUF1844 domain-containing protein [Verrucomicrobiae bacterium]|nr:DUF1844 domain-containing protein [Verrucomicrobiae bacterium]
MNQHSSTGESEAAGGQEEVSALFAQLILQQTNMAMMLLGKIAHPESGQVYKDVEAARLFIDQLEMLERKTRGNLTKEESGLLKQSLMNLRLAFVEAVDSGEPQKPPEAPPTKTVEGGGQESPGGPNQASGAPEEEHRKKFSKKY